MVGFASLVDLLTQLFSISATFAQYVMFNPLSVCDKDIYENLQIEFNKTEHNR